MRHYVRLSQKNYAIDTGLYPLGSCTMKHNPRLNEKMARLPGFADIHPLQPLSTVPGALALIDELARWLMDADRHARRRHVAEGRRAWRALRHDGDQGRHRGARRGRNAQVVLVPDSAHGTNPATAALHRLHVEAVPARADGTVDRRGGARRAARARCRRDHADQPQHLRPVRARCRRHRRGGA